MSRYPWVVCLGFAALAGCLGDSAGGDEPGTLTGSCLDGACFDGLECRSGVCIEPEGPSNDSAPGGSTSGPGETTTSSAETTGGAHSSTESTAGPTTTTTGPDTGPGRTTADDTGSDSTTTGSTTTGGSTSDSESSTGAPSSCEVEGTDNACVSCAKEMCCDAFEACLLEGNAASGCFCVQACVADGGDLLACAETCGVGTPSPGTAAFDLSVCVASNCPACL